jgi:outer membrane protein TolC
MLPALVLAAELSFDAALQHIVEHNLQIRQADESLANARDKREQAGYVYFPSLDANGKLTRKGDDQGGRERYESVGVASSVNLYRFGGDRAVVDAAQARADQAENERTEAFDAAEADAADALISLIAAYKERDIADAVLKSRLANLDMAKRLYQKGLRPAQDVEKVQIDAANEQETLREAELQLANAQARVVELAGEELTLKPEWPWAERFRADAAAAAGSAPAAGAAAITITAQAPDPTARADRRALSDRIKALDADAKESRAQGLPTLDLDLGYDRVRDDELRATAGQWSGALVLTVPLFDRFASSTAQRDQLRQKAIAELDLAVKDRALRNEWDTARTSFASALASVTAREQTLALARGLYDRSLKSFQSGVLSANELSQDQDRLLESELNALRGWTSAHRSFVKLCRARGLRLEPCLR